MNGSTRNSTLLLDIAESDADVRRRYTCAVIFDYFMYGLCHLESAVPIQQNQAVESLGSALEAFLYQTARQGTAIGDLTLYAEHLKLLGYSKVGEGVRFDNQNSSLIITGQLARHYIVIVDEQLPLCK